MRLVQLIGDGYEELWEFPDGITDEQIEDWYKEYHEDDETDSFEEFMEEHYPKIECVRKFVDEIYVD